MAVLLQRPSCSSVTKLLRSIRFARRTKLPDDSYRSDYVTMGIFPSHVWGFLLYLGSRIPLMSRSCLVGTFVLPGWISPVLCIPTPPCCRLYRRIFARSGNGQLRTTRAGHCGVGGPPFAPYISPNLRESPRLPADTERRAARAKWLRYSNRGKRSLTPQ